jgi:acyl-coenzyme A thioesterase PaaI-like protein
MPDIPARIVCGLDDPFMADELLTGNMRISRVVCEPGGALVPGAVAVLADSCLGMALIEGFEQPTAMVTSHLHIEFMRQVPREMTDLSCAAAVRCIDGNFGLTDGSISDGSGAELARATLGGVFVTTPESASVERAVDGDDPIAPFTAFSDVDALLGTDVVCLSSTDAVVEFELGEHLSNLFGNVHGGMGALMGARAIDLVVHQATPSRGLRLADVRAVFPKPIPANGGRARCIVSVPHRGRRLTVAGAEVHAPDGRLAIMVDTTYVATTE